MSIGSRLANASSRSNARCTWPLTPSSTCGRSPRKENSSRARRVSNSPPPPITNASAPPMISTVPNLRRIFTFRSKKRTSGFAIRAMMPPATKGLKKRSAFGSSHTVSAMVPNGIRIFRMILASLRNVVTVTGRLLFILFPSAAFSLAGTP